jgi:hypothetical protein
LVRVPDEGVPSTPPLTTRDPADPTLTPTAVITPEPVAVDAGALPAPLPITSVLLFKTALDDMTVVELK